MDSNSIQYFMDRIVIKTKTEEESDDDPNIKEIIHRSLEIERFNNSASFIIIEKGQPAEIFLNKEFLIKVRDFINKILGD